jgi:hypothetical protein
MREMVAVLPMSAVLAGRLLGTGLDRARMTPALTAVLAGYLARPRGSTATASTPCCPGTRTPT